MRTPDDVRSLLARRKPGHSLEAPFYTRRDIFELDLALIFGRHWFCVGVEPELPEPGDYFTVEIGKDSVVIVRDDDMAVKAFHNVCRHRGARICEAGRGAVGNLVCPYHQWTYDLRGNLIHNEHMGEKFDRAQFRLKPAHLRSIGGVLFLCLADEPPADFETMRAAMEPYVSPHRLTDCKVAHQVELIEEGNWKLTMENNRECYHCMGNHPELTISLYEYGFGYQPSPANQAQIEQFQNRLESEHRRWQAMGLPSAEIERLSDVTGFRTVRLPLDKSGESQTMDTRVASQRLLGDFQQRDLGGLSFWTQPNSWHHFMSDHIVTFSALPLAPDRTLLKTSWLVHKDAKEGIDYDVEKLTAVWNATNVQDRRLVEISQRGVSSSAYEPGPYSPYTESLVEKFSDWYVRRLSAALG